MTLSRVMDAVDVAAEHWPAGVRAYVRRFAEHGVSASVGEPWLWRIADALEALVPVLDGELRVEAETILAQVRTHLPKKRKKTKGADE